MGYKKKITIPTLEWSEIYFWMVNKKKIGVYLTIISCLLTFCMLPLSTVHEIHVLVDYFYFWNSPFISFKELVLLDSEQVVIVILVNNWKALIMQARLREQSSDFCWIGENFMFTNTNLYSDSISEFQQGSLVYFYPNVSWNGIYCCLLNI